ncbi:MAG: iron-containing alcohol dehydrogenase [Clostridia bacterium]|nr:iron-containing alcohol dehydrogenase [Clostridia bacterium]
MFENVMKLTRSCSCGKKHSLLTDECVVGHDAEKRMQMYMAEKQFRAPVIVCDDNTRVFADRITAAVPAQIIAVDGHAHATEVYCGQVNAFLEQNSPDVLIACGSGSVHDITRYCAFEKKIPFISYPTAASVDGFVSSVAAMTWYGQKLTFESAPPIAVFANPEVYCTAPERLTASGVGDVLGKYTSLFDWKVAKSLIGEYYCSEISDLEYEAVRELKEAVYARASISKEAYTTKVMNGLLLSGLAMQLAGNSRPASGAEHHMSHLWEMARINEDTDALHGEKVAVGLLAVVRRYKSCLAAGLDFDRIADIDLEKVMSRAYLEPVYKELLEPTLKENLPGGTLQSSSLAKIDVTDRERIAREIAEADAGLPSAEEIEKLLVLADVTRTPADVHLPEDDAFIEKSLRFAPYVRNRLTLLKVIAAAEIE